MPSMKCGGGMNGGHKTTDILSDNQPSPQKSKASVGKKVGAQAAAEAIARRGKKTPATVIEE